MTVTLTPPDTDELLIEMRESAWASSTDEEFGELMLQRATDLFHMATGITEDPIDETAYRIFQMGVLVMAHALFVRSNDADAILSPFQSERLGSYSYTKIISQVAKKGDTGVEIFDVAVDYFTGGLEDSGAFAVTSEKVFQQTHKGFVQEVYGDEGHEGTDAASKWPQLVVDNFGG